MTVDTSAPATETDRTADFINHVSTYIEAVKSHWHHEGSPKEHLLRHLPLAEEDIPEDCRAEAQEVLGHPLEDGGLYKRVLDVVANASAMTWGDVEALTKNVPVLRCLSNISLHQPYSYRVGPSLIRGSRPSSDKLRRLHDGGCHATINLCEEMPRGDEDLIAEAGLTDMRSHHIPIVDNHTPEPGDIREFFTFLSGLKGETAYVHCQAGVGRTGIMVACYRIARGCDSGAAEAEARRFGCATPDQLAYIEQTAANIVASFQPNLPQEPEIEATTLVANADPDGLATALARRNA